MRVCLSRFLHPIFFPITRFDCEISFFESWNLKKTKPKAGCKQGMAWYAAAPAEQSSMLQSEVRDVMPPTHLQIIFLVACCVCGSRVREQTWTNHQHCMTWHGITISYVMSHPGLRPITSSSPWAVNITSTGMDTQLITTYLAPRFHDLDTW